MVVETPEKLCSISIRELCAVWACVVNNQLNDAGKGVKADSQEACPASWKLLNREQCAALHAGIFGEICKFSN